MKICIDLGTARTAIAIRDNAGHWVNFPAPRLSGKGAGSENQPLQTLIKAVQGVEVLQDPIPHLIVLSRYCKLSEIVVPFCLDASYVSVPGGVDLFPSGRLQETFENIKESDTLVTPFLSAVTRLAAALRGEGAQWIVGRSAGGLDLRRLGLPPGSRSFNEAAAVVFSLVSHNIGGIRNIEPRPFVLVADLGGGFLDVSVADGIQFEETGARATIVNYGGYPVGVDRIDPSQRFSKKRMSNPDHLIELVGLVVIYHIWDYMKKIAGQRGARTRGEIDGLVILTGGGFKRIDQQKVKDYLKVTIDKFAREVIKKPQVKIQLRVPQEDTKYLTLAGLGRMEEVGLTDDDEEEDRNISRRSPSFYGEEVLQWLKVQPKTAENWSALLDQERRDRYGR